MGGMTTALIGAIAGDVMGSVYEGAGVKRKDVQLFRRQARPTDDTILTLAVARAIMESGGEPTVEQFAEALRGFGRRYPRAGYGGSFVRWLGDDGMGPYGSWGNGSAMRSSAVGWAYESADDVLCYAERSALPTHDHREGVKGAQAVALAVFLARKGASRGELRRELAHRFGYDLDRSVDEIRPHYSFEVSCQKSVPESIVAFLDSNDFEDAIRNAISLGGDADTQACIAGAVAEAFYGGVPASILSWVLPRLDGPQARIVRVFAERYLLESPLPSTIDEMVGERLHSDEAAQPAYRELGYRILLHRDTWERMADYARRVDQGVEDAGQHLARQIDTLTRLPGYEEDESPERRELTADLLLNGLLNTKFPRIFAESEVRGDGGDWIREELSLLGDVGVAVPVTIYDDGRHRAPRVHDTPISGTLLFIPGALLRSDSGSTPADWDAVVRDGEIDQELFRALYERRLLPLLKYAANRSRGAGRQALVTIPGLGCGQFSGPFRGELGARLRDALHAILTRHAAELESLRAVWFDPYDECDNERYEIGSISYLVRPLLRNSPGCPQLCRPSDYEESNDDYSRCDLYSVVAWDHVSWPGNDFFAGVRSTDDGVKAAATDSMYALTGFRGSYDRASNTYQPPQDARTWESLVRSCGLRLEAENNVVVVGAGGEG